MNEFALIEQIFANQKLTNHPSLTNIHKAIGDDAAVIEPPPKQKLVTCVDTLVQGRHFFADWQMVEELAFSIGYKAVAVNLSDLAAMGATPHSILLALALPNRLNHPNWLNPFAKGLFAACEMANVALIGGDTTQHDQLVISITAQGFAERCVYRHTAQIDDDLYVSGTLGDASLVLSRLQQSPKSHHLDDSMLNRLHQPTPRLQLGKQLSNIAHAMIDISDGLAQDLGHICQQSGVSCRLDLDKLPASVTLSQLPIEQRLIHQLTGGDDYELLFTLPPNISPPTTDVNIHKIGKIIAKTPKNIHLYYQNQPVTKDRPFPFCQYPDLTGYQHFC